MLIHIGLHKCASSFLLHEVFAKNPHLMCLSGADKLVLTNSLTSAASPYFDRSECLALFEKMLLTPAKVNNQVPVFSAERLSGIPYFGSFDRLTIGLRLSQLFPNVKILIVIRNQQDLIKSVYGQYIKIGGTLKITDFLHHRWKGPEFSHFNLEQFDFYKLYQHYSNVFSPAQVLILPFEQLAMDPEIFIHKIYKFIDAPSNLESINLNHQPNKTPPFSQLNIIRMINKIILPKPNMINHSPLMIHKGLYATITKLISQVNYAPASQKISASIKTYVGDYFRSGNEQLNQTLNLELHKLGYDL